MWFLCPGQTILGHRYRLIVISADFKNRGLLERMELSGLASGRIMAPVQAYGFTPEEIERGEVPPFLSEVLEREAVVVKREAPSLKTETLSRDPLPARDRN